METRINLRCPYCKKESLYFVTARAGGQMQVVLCDTEERDGCGNFFVVDAEVKVGVRIFTITGVTE